MNEGTNKEVVIYTVGDEGFISLDADTRNVVADIKFKINLTVTQRRSLGTNSTRCKEYVDGLLADSKHGRISKEKYDNIFFNN